MTSNEEKVLKATQALTFLQDTLSDHGTALTKTEVETLLHGITATLAKITK